MLTTWFQSSKESLFLRRKEELQEEARRLRREGKSIKEIARKIGAAQSSVSVWVRDIELSESQKTALIDKRRQRGENNAGAKSNQQRYMEKRRVYQATGRTTADEKNFLHIAGCMLYWAEGSKDRNRLEFVNADQNMMKLFIRFVREELQVDDIDIKINIHCHTDLASEQASIQRYWCDILNLPDTAIRNVYRKKGGLSRRNRLKNGVCGIRIDNTEMVQHIYGAIQEYGGFNNPDWLF